MDALSVRNDLPGFPLALLPVLLAIFCAPILVLARRKIASYLVRGWSNRVFWLFLVATAGVSALFFTDLQPYVTPWGGMDRYWVRAINILSHGVFGYGTTPTAVFPPGYSFLLLPLLVVLGETRWVFFLTNVALLILFALLLRRILLAIGATERTANILSILVSFFPNRLVSVLLPFSDVPFALIYGAAFALLMLRILRRATMGSAIGIGVAAAIATLVRSNGLVLFLPLLFGIIVRRESKLQWSMKEGAAALVVFLLLLVPWTIRNYGLFGRLVPVSANAGINIAIGNNPSGPVTHNSYIDSIWSDSSAWKQIGGMQWNDAQRDSFFARMGIAYIEDHPVDFVLRSFAKLSRTFGADNYSFGHLKTYTNATTIVYSATRESRIPRWLITVSATIVGTALTLLLLLNGTLYYLLLFFSVYLFVSGKGKLPATIRWVILLIIGGVAAMVVATFGLSRYKEPVEIVLMLYCTFEFFLWSRTESASGIPAAEKDPPQPS